VIKVDNVFTCRILNNSADFFQSKVDQRKYIVSSLTEISFSYI